MQPLSFWKVRDVGEDQELILYVVRIIKDWSGRILLYIVYFGQRSGRQFQISSINFKSPIYVQILKYVYWWWFKNEIQVHIQFSFSKISSEQSKKTGAVNEQSKNDDTCNAWARRQKEYRQLTIAWMVRTFFPITRGRA